MQRKARAHWQGSAQRGHGTLSLESGALTNAPYSFAARFASGTGTNPEELLAAAHAGCFSMAVAHVVSSEGYGVDAIDTEVMVTIEPIGEAPTITSAAIVTRVRAGGLDAARFAELAEAAKRGCALSRALAPGVHITLDATLF